MAKAPRLLSRKFCGQARGARHAVCFGLMAVLAGGLMAVTVTGPVTAQVLDAGRGFEDGCDRPAGPPESPIARTGDGPVVLARYFGATRAYGHGVLGDDIEGEGLLVRYDNGERVVCDTVLAGPDRVFEDVGPHLVDVDGDGQAEVIAVAAHQSFGARLEVYGYPELGRDFQLLAHTPYIGMRFRWRGIVGGADLDGDGFVEIAEIDRPHLAKTLRIWRYRDGALEPVTAQSGLTNHRIGEPFITGGIRDCGDRPDMAPEMLPEMVLANANWSRVMLARLVADRIELVEAGAFSQDRVADLLACR